MIVKREWDDRFGHLHEVAAEERSDVVGSEPRSVPINVCAILLSVTA